MTIDPNWAIFILQTVMFLGGGYALVYGLKSDIKVIDVKITSLEKQNETQNTRIDDMSSIRSTQAAHSQRFLNLERDISDLRRGKGYITE